MEGMLKEVLPPIWAALGTALAALAMRLLYQLGRKADREGARELTDQAHYALLARVKRAACKYASNEKRKQYVLDFAVNELHLPPALAGAAIEQLVEELKGTAKPRTPKAVNKTTTPK